MRVAVFCGSSPGNHPDYMVAARGLGALLAAEGIGLVYGGATVGTMGAVADGALAGGGEVIGVIPRTLVEREVAHRGLTELHEVATMHERKALMSDLADAFVVLPGGAGTLEELAEVWTWGPLLGLHDKPIGLLDVRGFWTRLLDLADHMVAEGFLRPADRATLLVDDDPRRLLTRFAGYRPPAHKYGSSSADTSLIEDEFSTGVGVVDALAWVHVRDDGRVLAVRARGRDALYFPGGKREPGETDHDALAREVREEVGVELRPGTFRSLGVFDAPAHDYPAGTRVRLACYAAGHDGDPKAAAEIDELVWLDPADHELGAPAVRMVLAALAGRGELG